MPTDSGGTDKNSSGNNNNPAQNSKDSDKQNNNPSSGAGNTSQQNGKSDNKTGGEKKPKSPMLPSRTKAMVLAASKGAKAKDQASKDVDQDGKSPATPAAPNGKERDSGPPTKWPSKAKQAVLSASKGEKASESPKPEKKSEVPKEPEKTAPPIPPRTGSGWKKAVLPSKAKQLVQAASQGQKGKTEEPPSAPTETKPSPNKAPDKSPTKSSVQKDASDGKKDVPKTPPSKKKGSPKTEPKHKRTASGAKDAPIGSKTPPTNKKESPKPGLNHKRTLSGGKDSFGKGGKTGPGRPSSYHTPPGITPPGMTPPSDPKSKDTKKEEGTNLFGKPGAAPPPTAGKGDPTAGGDGKEGDDGKPSEPSKKILLMTQRGEWSVLEQALRSMDPKNPNPEISVVDPVCIIWPR